MPRRRIRTAASYIVAVRRRGSPVGEKRRRSGLRPPELAGAIAGFRLGARPTEHLAALAGACA